MSENIVAEGGYEVIIKLGWLWKHNFFLTN